MRLRRHNPIATRYAQPQIATHKLDATRSRQALISTSTPEGRSSFDNASTVLEEEV